MKNLYAFLSFVILSIPFFSTGQTVTIPAVGALGSFATGSVNSTGTMNDGDMTGLSGAVGGNRGFAKFDLSGIPVNATIISATVEFYTQPGLTSSIANTLSGFIGDPASIAGATLFNDILAGANISLLPWSTAATNSLSVVPAGLAFLNANIGSNQVCIGFRRGSTNVFNISGYGATFAEVPKLIISYSIPCSGTPALSNVISSANPVCLNAAYTLSLSNIYGGVNYQWQSSPNGSTWTDIVGAVNATYATTFASSTFYQCRVSCLASGQNSTSTSLQITQNPLANCYCPSFASSNEDEDILNVTISTLNNTSECLIPAAGANSVLNQYANYTGIAPAVLTPGNIYPLSVEVGYCAPTGPDYTSAVAVYIDFNQNASFLDANEQVFLSPVGVLGAHVATGNINIPGGAPLGITRMRVVNREFVIVSDDPSVLTSCGSYGYGETEDYNVLIGLPPTCPFPSALLVSNLTSTTVNLNWTAGGSESQWIINYGTPGFTVNGVGQVGMVVTNTPSGTIIGLLQNTNYQATIRAICAPGDTSVVGSSVNFTPVASCPSPTLFSSTNASTTTATFAWTAGGSETNWILNYGTPGFVVNGLGQVGSVIINATNPYTLIGLAQNTSYQVYFRAVCGPADTSNSISPITFQTLPSCPAPLGLTLTNATGNSGSFTWTPAGPATSWIINYGTSGFITNGAGQLGSTIFNTLPNGTITGLPSNILVVARLRGICGPGDTSSFSNVVSFNTYNLGAFLDVDNSCLPFTSIVGLPGTLALNLLDDDEIGYTIPFNFYYQGTLVTNISIGNNGGIILNSLTGNVNYSLVTPFPNVIFPFIQDLFGTEYPGSNTHRLLTGTAPNRKLIIQWNDLRHFVSFGVPSPNGVTFQLVLNEAGGEFYFLYDDVIFGDPLFDNGLDADIGIKGTQNITLSSGSTTFLNNNSCAHFFYTDCPKPRNPVISALTISSVTLSWTPGLSSETTWIVEYGPNGFNPGTGAGIVNNVGGSPSFTVNFLTQLTEYDFYIYAQCSSVDTSTALFVNVLTLPFCNYPSNLTGVTDSDSLELDWDWTQSVASVTSFKISYGNVGTAVNPYLGTTIVANGLNSADTISNPALIAGGVYNVWVQAVCLNDTSLFVGPIVLTMPLTNDLVCGAELLPVNNQQVNLSNVGATVSAGEASLGVPATGYNTTTGWGAVTFDNTTWFKFVAPPSGNIRIDNTGLLLQTKIAVYSITNCASFASATLIAANDDNDEINSSGGQGSNFVVCGLISGQTYYIQHAMEIGTFFTYFPGNYSLKLKEVSPQAGSASAVVQPICYGGSLPLFPLITGIDSTGANGVWSTNLNTSNINGNGIFNTLGFASVNYIARYTLTEGCASDFVEINVLINPRLRAGLDGTTTVCRNEPVDLYSVLAGTVDHGGVFKNQANIQTATSTITTSNTPGTYTYTYIVGNGQCLADSATITIIVSASCDNAGLAFLSPDMFALSPNPTDGFVTLTTTNSANFKFELIDANGRIISSENDKEWNGSTVIDLSQQENGLYFIRIYNYENQQLVRVVKL